MEKHSIKIAIELEEGQLATLQLSPRSYKQSFRNFKAKYKLNQHDAFKIKNIIQAKLIQLADHTSSQIYFTPERNIKQKQSGRESPRFSKIVNDEEIQTDFPMPQSIKPQTKEYSVQLYEQEKQHQSLSYEKMIENFPKQNNRTNMIGRVKKPVIKIVDLYQQQPQWIREDSPPRPLSPPRKYINQKEDTTTLTSNQRFLQETGQKIKLFPQKKKQSENKTEINSQDINLKKKVNISYDRLYYESTDSFKSKKNQDINRKQFLDYLEVQKFELSNRLKRTTNQFFSHLHSHTTEAWENRIAPQKQKSLSQEKIYLSPQKKVPIQHAFKGSLWKSRMRCQARQYVKKLDAETLFRENQERRIMKRMQQQSKSKQKNTNDKSLYKSRICDKCSPKKIEHTKVKKKKKPNIISSIKDSRSNKKKFISNILLQAYQQRCQITQQVQY